MRADRAILCGMLAAWLGGSFAVPRAQAQWSPGGNPPGMSPGSNEATVANLQEADLQRRLAQIDAMVQQRMPQQDLPAYCLTVIKYGRVVFHKAYGFADLQQHIPASNETVFGLASNTKTFTALALLSLVDQGLVNLDDPLAKYIDGLTPPYRGLTIRQLASMTAGVPKVVSQEVPWRQQLDILDHTPLVSQPGSQFLYSNFSYRLLGSVIERATGRPYFEVVRDTILAPLQMNSTATTVMLQPTGHVAQAYGDNGGRGPLHAIEYKNPAISFAAGMLASTNDDLVNYVFGLLNRRILSEQGYRTLWYDRPPLTTGQPSNWAFGWGSAINTNFGTRTVSMNGGTPGVASSIIILPEQNAAVIGLCNIQKPAAHDVAREAARLAFGQSDAAPPGEAGEADYGGESAP